MRILLTAFEPYDDWQENSSWMALVRMLRQRPTGIDLVTRRYPVDLQKLQECLDRDLDADFDAVLHTGQAPGSPQVKLESIALNIAGVADHPNEELPPLVEGAPLAFRCSLPLSACAQALQVANVPGKISYHAGTYLCNATMYLSHLWYFRSGLECPVGFVHLPLASEQVAASSSAWASLPTDTLATALQVLLETLSRYDRHQPPLFV